MSLSDRPGAKAGTRNEDTIVVVPVGHDSMPKWLQASLHLQLVFVDEVQHLPYLVGLGIRSVCLEVHER